MINQNLTICFLGNAGSVHTIKWARYFSENGHNVHLLSFDPPETDDLRGVKIHILKNNQLINVKPFDILKNLFRVKRLIKEIKPDIINVHYLTSYGVLATLAGLRPFIMTVWGSDILINPKRNILMKLATKFVLRKASLITCDAKHMKKIMMDLGVSESKIKIINFGIDTRKFSPGEKNESIKQELDLSDNRTVISLKGLDPISDIKTIIRAASKVIKEYPEARFVLIGSSVYPEYLAELKNMVEKLGLNKEIKFLGRVLNEKIPEYLRTSDIYVCTSLSDAGIASSTAEAMACELPVIVTDFGENKEWVKDGENGFVIPLKDSEILAEKIIYLFNNQDIAKGFRQMNRRIIEERNDYYKEMKKMENIYLDIANKENIGK